MSMGVGEGAGGGGGGASVQANCDGPMWARFGMTPFARSSSVTLEICRRYGSRRLPIHFLI